MRIRLLAVPMLLVAGCGGDEKGSDPTSTSPPPAEPTLLGEVDLTTQTDSAYALEWGVDGETLAVSAGVELLLLHADLTEVAVLDPASGAIGTTVSPDGLQYATVGGLRNSTITIWDWDAGAQQLTLTQEIEAGVDQFAVSWSPDGALLASLAGDRESSLQVWDTTTWELVGEYELPYMNSRRALNWSADSTFVYDAGDLDGVAGYFSIDARSGQISQLGRLPLEHVVAFAMATDGSQVAIADASGMVRVVEVGGAEVLAEFQSDANPVHLAWNPNDGTLAVLSYSTALQVWSVS